MNILQICINCIFFEAFWWLNSLNIVNNINKFLIMFVQIKTTSVILIHFVFAHKKKKSFYFIHKNNIFNGEIMLIAVQKLQI